MMSETQRLAILGATGSIGASTLDLVRRHPERYRVHALSGYHQRDKLLALCCEFRPAWVGVAQDGDDFAAQLVSCGLETQVVVGADGLDWLASNAEVDVVVAAIVGAAGLSSTLAAVKAGKKVLLANKEALVMAGRLVMHTAQESGAQILPIDSEHNAIFQCLPSAVQRDAKSIQDTRYGIKKLWLTASGGAFLDKSLHEMRTASIADAISHPNWSMGQKISVDSSTMMNKGLELIEACHLFALDESDIEVVIHPESIVHSLVQYKDGSFLAQLGTPDMRTPIAHALAYPERIDSGVAALDLFAMRDLRFLPPDEEKFACLALARAAMRLGAGANIILNAANEVAVAAFLAEKIRLTDIAKVVRRCLYHPQLAPFHGAAFDELAAIMTLDVRARDLASDEVAQLATQMAIKGMS